MNKMFKLFDKDSILYLKKFIFVVWNSYRKQWAIGLVLMLLIVGLKLPLPLLTKYVIDKVIEGEDVSNLIKIITILVFATIIFLFLDSYKGYLLFRINKLLTIRYNRLLFKHIQSLPNDYVFSKGSGYLNARIINDPEKLNTVFIDTSLTIIQSTLIMIVSSFVLFNLNWKLTLSVFAVIPFYVFSHYLYINKIKIWNEHVKEERANISSMLTESLSAIQTVKLFLLEFSELLRFHKHLKSKYNYEKKEYLYTLYVNIIVSFFSSLIPIIILGYGGYEIVHGNFTIGGLIAFNTLLGYVFGPIRSLLSVHVSFQTSLVSLNRIYNILSLKKDDSQIKKSELCIPDNYSVEFNNVTFGYKKNEKILDNISFSISEGQKIGLVGSVGSGKTTIINLLNKFYIPSKGEILIGNYDINKIARKDLFNITGIVSQDTFLFSNTIYENIKIGNLKATKDDIINAANIAFVDDFVQGFEDKYDTMVGENGTFLSGGQKQLISIARVILKNPKIIIFDEPASSLDFKTETKINELITRYFKDKTCIIISHKIKSVESFDQILHIKDSNISKYSTIDEYISKN
jgi:ABC-type bacteriocin/lantibiotic exporter with double-glycine peptidase domain